MLSLEEIHKIYVNDVIYFQEEGVDINMLDGDEATPLHFAASRGHSDTVSFIFTQNYINIINPSQMKYVSMFTI